jgi:hypothetical protein
MPRTARRTALAIALGTLLAAPWAAQAAPRPRDTTNTERAKLAVTAFLAELGDSLVSLLSKAGCGIDPHGGCNPEPLPPENLDAGCGIDPHGCTK